MTSSEIRRQFLEFFADKVRQHEIVPSSPVVPHDDPTLMFTNAGMNQFKDVFLGTGTRPYTRAADTQKCIRAGGKHNDLDDVGQDTYHHTFFEMLGNWSFGDYFKAEAIAWAWELLTEVWKIEPDRLHATYFEGDKEDGLEADTEARDLWLEVLPPDRVHPGNKKDNFWEMGDSGPCGPCSEIHVDLTPDKSGAQLVNADDHRVMEIWNLVFIQFNRDASGKLSPLPAKHVDTGMGFERICAVLQGKKSNYDTDVWTPIFAAIQKRTGAPQYTGLIPGASEEHDQTALMRDVTYRVIADHLRCLTFAITDGAVPSNEGRGYVLRRILRRAVRYGRQYLDMHEPFLCDLVEPLVEHMANAFPELRSAHNVEHVKEILRDEEQSFLRTLDRGLRIFSAVVEGCFASRKYERVNPSDEYLRSVILNRFDDVSNVTVLSWNSWDEISPPAEVFEETRLTGQLASVITDDVLTEIRLHSTTIPGRVAFVLHDTFGFPIDLTQLIAAECGLTVDTSSYERLMEDAKALSRGGQPTRANDLYFELLRRVRGETTFLGYDQLDGESRISTMLDAAEMNETESISEGDTAWIVLNQTPFYPEQGGQVGDVGKLSSVTGDWEFEIDNTIKASDTIVHHGRCTRGSIWIDLPSAAKTGGPASTPCRAIVDELRRRPTMKNHTATHLLNWALRGVLGDGVQQKGSLVDPEKTRFDFSHNKPLSLEQLARVELLVGEQVAAGHRVYTQEVDQAAARGINTLRAVFGEKYPDVVRVVSIGADIDAMLADPTNEQWMAYSVEFCGGTHLSNSSEAECLVLVSEEGVAKGVRRVVGISGEAAKKAKANGEALVRRIESFSSDSTKELATFVADVQRDLADGDKPIPVVVRMNLREQLESLQKKLKKAEKQQSAATGEQVQQRVAELLDSAETINGVTVVVGEIESADANAFRGAIDWVRNKTESSAVLLATSDGEKVTLIAGMSKDTVGRGLKAGDLIREIAPVVGGKGGGRPDMAQGGGNDPSKISEAVSAAKAWVSQKLG